MCQDDMLAELLAQQRRTDDALRALKAELDTLRRRVEQREAALRRGLNQVLAGDDAKPARGNVLREKP